MSGRGGRIAALNSVMKRLWNRLGKTLEIAKAPDRYLLANWSHSPETFRNFGDALNRDLVSCISGKEPVHIKSVYNWKAAPVYNVIGSTLDSLSVRHLEVWGSGFKRAEGRLRRQPQKVHAVRGPLTRKRLAESQVSCPEVFGDPAMLCPRFFAPSADRCRYGLGIIAHYVDANHPWISAVRLGHPEVRVIDVLGGVTNVIQEVTECQIIASSSLHGLILADAYGIPSVWLRFSDKIIGGDFKFHDHFLAVDKPLTPPLQVQPSTEISEVIERAIAPPAQFHSDPLWFSCPFRRN